MKHQHPEIEQKIDSILENHLPHITSRLSGIEGALKFVFFPLAVAIIVLALKLSLE